MTNTVALQPGDVLPLVRELSGSPDPLALYRLLSDGGRRPGTFLALLTAHYYSSEPLRAR